MPSLTLPNQDVPIYVPMVPKVARPKIECSETWKSQFAAQTIEKAALLEDAYDAAARWTYWGLTLLQTLQGVSDEGDRADLWFDPGGWLPGNDALGSRLSVAPGRWFGEYKDGNLEKVEYRVRRMWETRFTDPAVDLTIHCEQPGYQGSACACGSLHWVGAIHTLFMQPCFCDQWFESEFEVWQEADWTSGNHSLDLTITEKAATTLVHELFHHVDWKLIDKHTCTAADPLNKAYYSKTDCIELADECPWMARMNVGSFTHFVSNLGVLVDHGHVTWPRQGLPEKHGGGGSAPKECTQHSDDPQGECIQVFPGYDN